MTRFSLAVSTTSIENSLSRLISTTRCVCVSRRASRRKFPRVSRVIAAATSGEMSFLGSSTRWVLKDCVGAFRYRCLEEA